MFWFSLNRNSSPIIADTGSASRGGGGGEVTAIYAGTGCAIFGVLFVEAENKFWGIIFGKITSSHKFWSFILEK